MVDSSSPSETDGTRLRLWMLVMETRSSFFIEPQTSSFDTSFDNDKRFYAFTIKKLPRSFCGSWQS